MDQYETINEATGFANGDRFTSDDEVRAYFQRVEFELAMPDVLVDELPTQDELDEWAALVIRERWHYEGSDTSDSTD